MGRELNVRYVLEGSVQRGGNRLRVNVQLIDAETGNHLWAERFDKPIADLLDTQDEIVSRLANSLGAELISAEATRGEGSAHPSSMDLVFRGRAWINKGFTPHHMANARALFEQAIAIDPENIEAMVNMATVDASVATALMTDDLSGRFAAAEATLTKVLSLAPNHAFAHAMWGLVQMYTNRVAQGIAHCEHALVLDRNSAHTHAMLGFAKYLAGRADETEAHIKDAFRLSPRDTFDYIWFVWIGVAKVQLNLDREALVWLRRGLDANRNYSLAHFQLAATLARLGELEPAREAVQAGLVLDPNFTIRRLRDATRAWGTHPGFVSGRERAIEGMRMAGVPEG